MEVDPFERSIQGQQDGLDDPKSVTGLSTLLVATIQDAKDRISRVEYIFCSQLYPNFQHNSKSVQKLCLEARKAAEDRWKEVQNQLADQLEKLSLEKEQVVKEYDGIKKENGDLMRTLFELQKELLLKDVEIENGKELLQKLTKKDQLLKGYEDKFLSLINRKDQLEEENCKLREELGKKNEELIRRKEVDEELFEHVSSQRKDIVKIEEKLHSKESESKRLELKVQELESSLERLNGNMGRKTIELEECRKLLEQLEQQNDMNISELERKDQLLNAHEKEKKMLLSRLNDLENKIEELQERPNDRNAVAREGREDYKHLMQQIESKASKLLTEKQKRKELLKSHKELRSQYNFLLVRAGLTEENMQLKPKVEDESEPRNHDDPETVQVKEEISPVCDPEEKTTHSYQTSAPVCQFSKVKKETSSGGSSNEEKSTKSSGTSTSGPPSTSNSPAPSKWKTCRNTRSSTKHPASNWRGAPRQGSHERDPHDDFLDTPLENIRGNLAKAVKEAAQEIPAPVSNDMVPDSSDDETQDMNAEAAVHRQQQQSSKRGPKAFKYIEPVRKKAQRENLKGVECRQCKKFYDAVLPDDQGKKGFRCEHLDGVSRHRYRYAPPMTPEGFWNIGFESEL